jgi:hypothetical protein
MSEPQIDWVAASTKQAKRRRDSGMQRAAEHAEAVIDGWQEKASEQLRIYVASRLGAPFLAEDFVSWSRYRVPAPPDGRAFGAVLKRAARSGWITKQGYAPAKSSNLSPKVLWAGVPQ